MKKKLVACMLCVFIFTQNVASEVQNESCLVLAQSLVVQTGALYFLEKARNSIKNYYEIPSFFRSVKEFANPLSYSGMYCTCVGLCLEAPCSSCCIATGFLAMNAGLILQQPKRLYLFVDDDEENNELL